MQAAHAHDPEEGQEGELGGVSPDHPRAAKLFCFDNDQGRWLLLDPAVRHLRQPPPANSTPLFFFTVATFAKTSKLDALWS
jgi:hypothetical protein